MGATLDMNSHPVINITDATGAHEATSLSQVIDLITASSQGVPLSLLPGTTGGVFTKFSDGSIALSRTVVSVKSFGAKGDGSTDDTTAIQNALNDTSFGVLYFPRGTYMINATGLTGTSSKFWVGEGIDISIIKLSAAPTTNPILFNSQTNAYFRDLTFDGNGKLTNFATSVYPNVLPIIYMLGGNNFGFNRVKFTGFDTCGLLTNTANTIVVKDCIFNGSTQTGGLALSGYRASATTGTNGSISASSTTFNSTTANFQPGDVGKLITINGAWTGGASLQATITARNSATQVVLDTPAATTVSTATFSYGGTPVGIYGLFLAGTGTAGAADNLYNFLVDGCQFNNCCCALSGHDGQFINNIINKPNFGAGVNTQGQLSNYNIVISGNVIHDGNPSRDSAGAYPGGIENWAYRSVVSNNTVRAMWGPGISVAGKNCTVTGNTSLNNGQSGVAGSAGIAAFYQDANFNCSGSIITGNKCTDDQGVKTQQYGYFEQSTLTSGSDVNPAMNDFGGNAIADTLLRSVPSRGINFNTVANLDSAAGFVGGNHQLIGTNGLSLNNNNWQHIIATGGTQTANRTLTINNNDGDRTVSLTGNLTTSGSQPITLTATGSTNVTLPTAGTLATLAGSETFTNKTLTSPTINTPTIAGGNVNALSGLSVADPSGFNFQFVSNSSPAQTANRSLTFNINNVSSTLGVTSSTSIGRGQYQGTNTNDSATAGNIGEYVSGSTGSTAMTTNVSQNAASISLTAGDWDVQGACQFTGQATTQVNYLDASISTTSATSDTSIDRQNRLIYPQTQLYNITSPGCVMTPWSRISLSSTTTVYCVANSAFNGGTQNVSGKIWARRVR